MLRSIRPQDLFFGHAKKRLGEHPLVFAHRRRGVGHRQLFVLSTHNPGLSGPGGRASFRAPSPACPATRQTPRRVGVLL